MPEIAVIDVIVPAVPVIDVHSVGVAGPAGEPGPPGPAGPPGPPGEGAGPHQASHAAGGADQIVGPLALGANPAQSGALRLANDTVIKARNAANSADVELLGLYANGTVVLGGIGGGTIYTGSAMTVAASVTTPQVATNTVAIGANPAQSGALRLGLGIGPAITAPNSSLTGDLIALQVHTDNKIYIGSADTFPDAGLVLRTAADHIDATKPIALGVNPAQTGALRLANNAAITARNGANTADLDLVQTNAANNLVIGGAANGVFIDSAADLALRGHGQGAHSQLYLSAGGTHPGGDGVNRLGLPSARFYDAHLSTSVSVGDNPAQTGSLRLPSSDGNAGVIAARNASGADVGLLQLYGDVIYVGDGGGNQGLVLRTGGATIQATKPVTAPYWVLAERPGTPGTPAADTAFLFLQDNGAGKSQLMVQFPTGGAVQIAIEP